MLFPQAGMKKPFSGSFSEAVKFTYDFFAKNPALVEKNGWALNIEYVEAFVDEYNTQRMIAGGYLNFVEVEGIVPAQKKTMMSRLSRSVVNVAEKVKTAAAIYLDLFGPDGKIVAKEEAERRAAVCVVCPKNDVTGGLTKYFLKESASEIMLVAGMLKDRDATTSLDDKLGVCQACECPMRAKVHVEAHVLKKHLKPDQIAKLDPNCWIPDAIA